MTNDQVKDCLQALLDIESGLSEWEVGFVEDMDKQDGRFTSRMEAKIIEIYDENC